VIALDSSSTASCHRGREGVLLVDAWGSIEELLQRPVDGDPWLLLEDAGGGAISVGPRFGRGARLCFRCYWARRASHNASGCSPWRGSWQAASGPLREALERLSGSLELRHAEQFLIPREGPMVRHRVLPLPSCSRCHSLPPPADALTLSDLLSERVGIVARVSDLAPGAAYLPTVVATGCRTDAFAPARAAAYGLAADTTRERASLRAIAECVERYCPSFAPPDLVRAHARQLEGAVLVSPETQQHEQAYPDQPLSWLQATCLGTGEPIWVPAGRLLLLFDPDPGPRVQTSCGLAAGSSVQDALQRAILEVEERDSFMRAWYGGEPPGVCEEPLLLPEMRLSRVPTPWGPPTVAAWLELPAPPFCSAGLSCRLEEAAAARSAQLEAIASHALALDALERGRHLPDGPVRRVTDYAFAHATRAELRASRRAWLEPQRRLASAEPRALDQYLARDLTTPDVALAGLHVVRVVHAQRIGFEVIGGGHSPAPHDVPHPFG
jgi:ribosomal protein S12 methylthiotransferase accessory factor